MKGGDEGAPVVAEHPDSPAAQAIRRAAVTITEQVPPADEETCTARIAVLREQLEAAQ